MILEVPVRLGQEEVESHGAGQGCSHAGRLHSGRSRHDNQQHQYERSTRMRRARPERNQERQHDAGATIDAAVTTPALRRMPDKPMAPSSSRSLASSQCGTGRPHVAGHHQSQ